ncbi:MAG TPA: M50 family metallopeptidase [Caulobacteraceae bacterium]|nr:M50 family metallopeptidase [Caulobacteraceae bacterium]
MLALLETAAIYVLPFLLIITFIVTVHELGHFLTARALGVAVDRFSVGFGRAIVSLRDRWGVEWRIGWLPLGGYVRFAGDENMASVPDQDDLAQLRARIVAREGVGSEKRYFPFKALWQRALVVAAGPMANFLLAIALFAILIGAFGEPVASTTVARLKPDSPAAAAGIRPGDVIAALNGHPLSSLDDLASYVQARAGVPMTLTIHRGANTLDVGVTPAVAVENSPVGGTVKVGELGLYSDVTMRRYSPIGAVARGAQKTWTVVAGTGEYFRRLVAGKADWQVVGFVGAARAAGAITQQAVDLSHTEHIDLGLTLAMRYLYLAAVLSVSIGLVNLLPIPILDGGHLLFYAYESVARRPLAAAAQAAGYRVGLALLVGLMLFTTWHDLQRLQVFHFLGALFS